VEFRAADSFDNIMEDKVVDDILTSGEMNLMSLFSEIVITDLHLRLIKA
jgi:hypothetical protein